MKANDTVKKSFRTQIAERFLKTLEKEGSAWQKTWVFSKTGRAANVATGKEYKGLNVLWLKMVENELGYGDNRWATFKQIQDLGWKLRKGSKGTKVEYWMPFDRKEGEVISWSKYNEIKNKDEVYVDEKGLAGERYTIKSKIFTVFNASQIDGVPKLDISPVYNKIKPSEVIEKISHGMGVEIKEYENSQTAYYDIALDELHMPKASQFKSDYKYNSTALHELAHATGHKSRLTRNLDGRFGSKKYAFEELVAEITSCFMSEYIESPMLNEDMQNHESYVRAWAKEIKENKTYLFKAIAEAERASDYMIEKGNLLEIKELAQEKLAQENEKDISEKELSEEINNVTVHESLTTIKVKYYPIDEKNAKLAKEMNSFSEYVSGSATLEYKNLVDEAVKIAESKKESVDQALHVKIDSLLDSYARKLADNMNKGYAIEAHVPSILVAGGSNFPTKQKEKQNAARSKNYEEFKQMQGLLDKINALGLGGISSDDPNAIKKLNDKLETLIKRQNAMKAVNAYFKKHSTLDGCPDLDKKEAEELKELMKSGGSRTNKPYPTWELSNNNAEIRRIKGRIQSLSVDKNTIYTGWEFPGGFAKANAKENRLQLFFEEKPDSQLRSELKSSGFRWSPKAGAWQRQLNNNAIYAADSISSLKPISGESVLELEKNFRKSDKSEVLQDTFTIYQLKDNENTRNIRFVEYTYLKESGKKLNPENYIKVYSAELKTQASLEDIYTEFNMNHPKDFTGHSLSISDIVVIEKQGEEKAYYVDKIGFKEVDEFLKEDIRIDNNEIVETGTVSKTEKVEEYMDMELEFGM